MAVQKLACHYRGCNYKKCAFQESKDKKPPDEDIIMPHVASPTLYDKCLHWGWLNVMSNVFP